MRQTIEKIWTLMNVTVDELNKEIPGIIIRQDSYKEFDATFRMLYAKLRDEYMNDTVENLDRHKVASIIMTSILKANIITYNGKIEPGTKFFGQYLIAGSVGITYMINQLNTILLEKNEEPIKRLWFPEALSCNTPYFEIFCRNLYYANNNEEWKLNPLDIAEKLFLLEYITLEKKGINPLKLKNSI